MSETAVMLVGQTRTFRHVWKTQAWGVYRKLSNPAFYVTVEDDADAKDMDVLRDHFPKVFINRVTTPKSLPEVPMDACVHSPYAPATFDTSVFVRTLWNFREAWRFYLEKRTEDPIMIVKTRPDIWVHSFEMPRRPPRPNEGMFLWWARVGGINCRICVMGEMAAPAYFTTFDRIDALLKSGAPFHGETFMAASLESVGAKILHSTIAWVSILRPQDEKGQFKLIGPTTTAEEHIMATRDVAGGLWS